MTCSARNNAQYYGSHGECCPHEFLEDGMFVQRCCFCGNLTQPDKPHGFAFFGKRDGQK